MKLEAVNTRVPPHIEGFPTKDVSVTSERLSSCILFFIVHVDNKPVICISDDLKHVLHGNYTYNLVCRTLLTPLEPQLPSNLLISVFFIA